jgi:hypothetical protein
MRYCGECGSSLGVESLYTLRCPNCGASVEANGSFAGMVDPGLLENPTRAAAGQPAAGAPEKTGGHLPERGGSQPRRVLWAIGLLAAALLLLAGGTALVLSHVEKGATTTHLTTAGIRSPIPARAQAGHHRATAARPPSARDQAGSLQP